MATATQKEPLISAEDFAKRPDAGVPQELVRGRVITMTPPRPYHGYVCLNLGSLLREHVKTHDLGYVMTNDSGVITQRGPDTVRGADVAFYSYAKVPKGTLPRDRYLDVAPDLVAEVLSPEDRWSQVLMKVAEYLGAGVGVVLVLDPARKTVHLYEGNEPVRILTEAEELVLAGVLGEGFRVSVDRLFE